MTPEQLLTLIEHGGIAIVLWVLLNRVMARLDAVTDKLIDILEHQRAIIASVQDAKMKGAQNSDV